MKKCKLCKNQTADWENYCSNCCEKIDDLKLHKVASLYAEYGPKIFDRLEQLVKEQGLDDTRIDKDIFSLLKL